MREEALVTRGQHQSGHISACPGLARSASASSGQDEQHSAFGILFACSGFWTAEFFDSFDDVLRLLCPTRSLCPI